MNGAMAELPASERAAPRFRRPSAGSTPGTRIRKETLVGVLLTTIMVVVLVRGTGMWFGLPSTFSEDAVVDPLPQKLQLYSLVPLIGLYLLLEPNRMGGHLRRVPSSLWFVIIVSILSLSVSINFGASFRGLAAVALLTVGPLLYRCRYGKAQTMQLLSKFFIVTAYLNIAYTVLFPQYAVMGGSYAGMVKGLFYHKNLAGQFFAIGFLVILLDSSVRAAISGKFLIKAVAMVIALSMVVLSRSSTAVVMLGVGMVLIFAIRGLKVFGNIYVRALLILMVAIFGGIAVAGLYLGVVQTVAAAFGKDLTFSGRSDIWEQLIPLIYDRPLLGYGFAVFRQPDIIAYYVHDTFNVRSVHNTYLELTLNIGLPATVIWIWFVFSRLLRKLLVFDLHNWERNATVTEIVIIVLVMVSCVMEAGMMLAPIILCSLLTICLPLRDKVR